MFENSKFLNELNPDFFFNGICYDFRLWISNTKTWMIRFLLLPLYSIPLDAHFLIPFILSKTDFHTFDSFGGTSRQKSRKMSWQKKWSHPSTLMMTRTASEVVKFIPKVQKSRRIVMAIPNRLCGVHFYVRCRNAIACDAKQRWKEKAVVQETK